MSKRFDYTAYDDGTESIYDRKKDEYYFDMQLSEIEELMNELADENERLKQEIKKWKGKYYDAQTIVIDEYSSNTEYDMGRLHTEVYGDD